MARRPEGWTLVEDQRTGNWLVRFRREDGSRVMRSTGTRDRRAAQTEATRIYRAEVGRTVERVTRGRTRLDDDLVAQWIRDFGATHSPETVEAYEAYAAVHWLPRWPTVESIDPAAYVRDRLRSVTASTVRKEASALRSFLGWLVEHGTVAESPNVVVVHPESPFRTLQDLVNAAAHEDYMSFMQVARQHLKGKTLLDAALREMRLGHTTVAEVMRISNQVEE